MTIFAENRVETFKDYFDPDLVARFVLVANDLKTNIPIDKKFPENKRAIRILEARKILKQFLRSSMHMRHKNQLDAIYGHILHEREFNVALTAIEEIDVIERISTISQLTINDAFTQQDVVFVLEIETELDRPGPGTGPTPHAPQIPGNPGGGSGIPGGIPPKIKVRSTLPGYNGLRFSREQQTAIFLLQQYVNGGSEQRFRKRLLTAECQIGLKSHGDALETFKNILDDSGLNLDLPHQKFIQLRLVSVHLALGDQAYRQIRTTNDTNKNIAVEAYSSAKRIIALSVISVNNPLRQEFEERADQQLKKLNSGFNFLGLSNHVVPIQRHEALKDLVNTRLSILQDATSKFEQYREKADRLNTIDIDLANQLDIAKENINISLLKINRATQEGEAAQNQLDELVDFRDAQIFVSASKLFESVVSSGGLGMISIATEANARDVQLDYQMEAARIRKRISATDVGIARSEQKIGELQRDAIEDAQKRAMDKTFNKDLFYQLARIYEELVYRHLDVAVLQAYLYERAVAFFLAKTDLKIVKFDYADGGTASFLTAADRLRDDVTSIDEISKSDPIKTDEFEEIISLQERYPLEFAQFQQTGKIDFVVSLYDLDKKGRGRPGTYRRRIQDVAVQIIGLIPTTGFTGHITHHGTFLLRDRDATLDPNTTRLIPTQQELDDAFEQLSEGDALGVTVGGITAFAVDEDTKQLSVDTIPNPGSESHLFQLKLIEKYGVAGFWSLELDNLDFRLVSDVRVVFNNVETAEQDNALRTKVQQLVNEFEKDATNDVLDRIISVSLRRRFPNQLDELTTGSTQIRLEGDHFPIGITGLRLKKLVVQALDDDGNGIEALGLSISNEDTTFTLNTFTNENGFSQNIDQEDDILEPSERVPALGAWNIDLDTSTLVSELVDLKLLMLYEFQEAV